MKNIVIFGASGHGCVVLDCIEQEGKYNIIGFIDSFKEKGKKMNGYQILGSEFDLPYYIEKFNLYGGIVAIGDNWTRREVVGRIRKISPNFNFISAVHPRSIIGKDVNIGKGSVIMPGVTINTNSKVGDFCILNTNSSLDHDGFMCNYSSLAPGVITGGNLYLGQYSAICLGSNVLENKSIGKHTVIGAGSLVVSDFGDYQVAYGSPAVMIRAREAGEPYLSGSKDSAPFPAIAKNF